LKLNPKDLLEKPIILGRDKKIKGFTLIEVMMVIVIMGILAAIAIPNYQAFKARAREASVKSNVHTLQMTVEDFMIRSGGLYPGNLATTIIEANPAYGGPEPNICVAALFIPPYGYNSILPNAVRNPFSPSYNALVDGKPSFGIDPTGIVGYQASITPSDDPIDGDPWTEVTGGPATMYRISGLGIKGIIIVVYQGGNR